MSLEQYIEDLKEFKRERNWEEFQTPKNLVMALTGEVGELAEVFQWLTEEQAKNIMQNPDLQQDAREELADVFSYVISLATALDLDIVEEAQKKLVKTKLKYPVEKSKGIATKYNKL